MSNNQISKSPAGWWIALAVLPVLGTAMGLYMNRRGVDVEPDSAVYMTAGILCAHGQGISMPNFIGAPEPMIWFPPATSWMVALFEWNGLDIRKSFGAVNAIEWGLLIGWIGFLARRITGGRSALGILAAGAILTSNAICTVHGFLYSEPLFLLCMLGTLVSLAKWWESPALRWAVVAGLCVGVGLLTRYVGITLLAVGGLVLVVRLGVKWQQRLLALAVFGVLGGSPMCGWHLFQKVAKSAATAGRTVAWHPITVDQINEGIGTIASFVVPATITDGLSATRIIAGVLMAVIVAAVWIWLGRKDSTLREKLSAVPALTGISAAFIAIYIAFLVVSISVADSSTPLDWRILSIIVPPGAIIMAYLASVAVWEHGAWLARGTVVIVTGAILLTLGYFTFRETVCRKKIYWMPGDTSDVLDALRTVPDGATLFSSAPCEVYMVVRRKSEDLPHPPPEDGWHNSERKDYQAEIAALQKTLAPQGGWVVYWDGFDGAPAIPQETLQSVLPVIEKRAFPDGALFHIAPVVTKR